MAAKPKQGSMFSARAAASHATRRKATARHRRLLVESLEPRSLLANMAVTNAYLIELDGDPVAEPTTGTLVRGRVDFTSSGIPSGTPFQVKFTFDNKTYIRNMKAGVISSVTDENWLLDPGPHTFQVEIDSLNQIIESSGADNFKSVTINPVTFSSPYQTETRFATPIAGTWGTNWWINNYADVNTAKGPYADHTGGDETYDGHDALDIDIDGFAAQDIGVPIFAAAGGVVIQRADGNYDRNTTLCKAACEGGYWGNYAVVDHGNGWQTRYLHMRKNAVAVSVGDVVKAGDILGLVGSSGNSTGPHLHFAVYRNGQMVETYVDPSGYWIDPVPYNDGPESLVPPAFYYVTENSKNALVKVLSPDPVAGGEVSYNTSGGSATPGADYQPKSGILNFDLIQFPKVVSVPLINDVRREPVESFFLHTSSDEQGDQSELVLIADNDAVLQLNDVTKELLVNANLAPDNDDVIVVDIVGTFFRVTINGQPYTFPLALMSKATILAGSGEDHVYVEETAAGKPVTINAGNGDDTVRVGAGDILKILDLIQGTLTLNGVSGDDKLYFDDDVPLGPQDYDVSNNALVRAGAAGMFFSNMDDVILNAGPSDDTIDVRAVLNGTALEVNGGNGGDTITLGAGVNVNKLDGFQGNATIDGEVGNDTLIFKDNASAVGRTYELTGSYLIRSNAATVFYGGIEEVTLNATGFADKIGVQGTSATTLVNALGGIDKIDVTSQQKNLELASGLTVNGGAGSDTVSFHDQNNPYDAGALGKLYTLTNNSVGRWFMAGQFGPFFLNLSYQAAEIVHFYGGSGGNIIGVQSTAAGVGTHIHAGTGNDVVNVGDGSNKLDGIQGALVINGLAHAAGDSVFVHDEGQVVPFTYTVNATSVSRPGIANISFGTVEAFQLNAGSAGDTINVNGSAALTPATINAGDGNDHIEVNTPKGLDNLKGTLTVNGQGETPNSLGDGLELRDDPNLLGHTYTINDGLITRNGIAPINYSGIDHLGMVGGTKDDLFQVQSMPDEMLFLQVSGHAGNDTIAIGSPANTLDAIDQVFIADTGGGFDQVIVNDQGNPNPAAYNVHDFEINRVGPHFVLGYGQSPPEKITFNAGSGGNTFTMHTNSPATPITINAGAGNDLMLMLPTLSAAGLKFDGQGGINTLDYAAYFADIYVNLATGQAKNVGGGIANYHNVIGGAGSDILVGNDQTNTLAGNAGRDLLFGGLGGDGLLGGLNDDLLVGGTTTHSTFAALNALRNEWKRLDADYETRIAHLTSGLNGATLLNLSTVPSDGVANRLSGLDDLDWFFANQFDATDLDALNEELVAI